MGPSPHVPGSSIANQGQATQGTRWRYRRDTWPRTASIVLPFCLAASLGGALPQAAARAS